MSGITEPTTLTREQVRAALDVLGIGDYHHVRNVLIEPCAVRVERYRLDEQGHFYAAGNEAATVTIVIGIDDSTPSEPA